MRIVFEKVRYKNFLASGNDFIEILLNKNHHTLMMGDNGAGKSTFIEAITFALFKKSFRGINKPMLVNTINKGNTVVELEFMIGSKRYMVRRGIKPEIFEIYENGVLKNNEGVWDQQKHLENDILHLNYKVFSQIVILSNKSHVPFMELPALDKRTIIENLLDIGVFSSMAKINKSRLVSCREEIDSVKRDIDVVKAKIAIHEKNISESQRDKQAEIEHNEKEIWRHDAEILSLQEENEDLRCANQQLEEGIKHKIEVEQRGKKLDNLHSQIQQNKSRTAREIEFLEENDDCPTCKRELDKGVKAEQLEELRKKHQEYHSGTEKLNSEMLKLKKTLNEISEVVNSIGEHNKTIYQNDVKIKQLQTWIRKLEQENVKLKEKNESLVDDNLELQSLNTSVRMLTDRLGGCLEDKAYLEKAEMLLKDSGIKTIIIKQYLPLINKSINKYLSFMDFFVNFSLNEEFEESIKSRFVDEFSYQNFSDGQKMRINLAILFSWIHLAKVKNSIDTNLLIMDEILDSSLDPQGTEECLKLIQNFSKETNIFVISPKPDQFLDKFSHVVKFQLKNNFSEIV